MAIIKSDSKIVNSSLEGANMTIDVESRFVYEQYIKIYTDKYTFLREITTNAFDAVIELWETSYKDTITKEEFLKENPIVLGIYSDESGKYISIKETKGIGMSPERMLDYLKITSSSKRNSEHQIGAKGIGRLSALAYQNEYYIETVYNNIKYIYMVDFYKNVPKISEVTKFKTVEPNHTAIKIYVKNFKEEQPYILNYINQNLQFFDNLVVEQLDYVNINMYYDDYEDYSIRNESSYDTFKKIPNAIVENVRNMDNIFLKLGVIYYRVEMSKLNMTRSEKDLYNSTMLIQNIIYNFKPSDLDVIASRDSLEYTDRTIKVIKDKMNKVVEIFKIKYSELFNELISTKVYCETLNKLFASPFTKRVGNIHINHKTVIDTKSLRFDDYFSKITEKLIITHRDRRGITYIDTSNTNKQDYLITSSNILKIDSAGKRCIFIEDNKKEDLEEAYKFIKFALPDDLRNERISKSKIPKTKNTPLVKPIYCYLTINSNTEELRSKEEFDKSLIRCKEMNYESYSVFYDSSTKKDVGTFVYSIVETSKPNTYVYYTSNNNSKRLEGIPKIQERKVDINKIANAYLIEKMKSNEYFVVSSDYKKFVLIIKTLIDRYGWEGNYDVTKYINYLGKFIRYSKIYASECSFEFGTQNFDKEFYELFIESASRLEVIGEDYNCVFERIANRVRHYNFANSYQSIATALESKEITYCIELATKLLTLYPVVDTSISDKYKQQFQKITLNN